MNSIKRWSQLMGVLTMSALCFSVNSQVPTDNIERIELGQLRASSPKPWAGKGFTKVKTINNVTYGLTRHKDSVGNFDKFTVDTSFDGGYTWQNTPQTVVSNSDIVAVGNQNGKDYRYNQFESLKWFECPATSGWSIYAKRLDSDSNGNIDYVNGKQLFGATMTTVGGNVDSAYNTVRLDYPYGSASGDLGNTVVDDKAYIISTGRTDHTIRFLELTNDCSDIVDADVVGAQPAKTLQWYRDNGTAEPREAPALFVYDDIYYMITSGATGWRPNQQKYAWSTEFLGNWSDMIPIADRTAYHSQVFWVKGITASNNSGKEAKLFTGTRNAQVWNGTDTRDVLTPIYFNKPGNIATNHYDYIDINHTTGDVVGGRYDHGTRLTPTAVSLENNSDNVSQLIDGDFTTAWQKGNVSGKDVIIIDLGSDRLVKALKVKQYDNFNASRPGEVEQKVFRVRIEVGDGQQYTTVFEDIIPSISWLHPLNLIDSNGRYIRITRLETHNGGNNAVQKHFGFYELEVWGETGANVGQVSGDFEGSTLNSPPDQWQVNNTNNTNAQVSDDITHGNVLKLTDTNTRNSTYVMKQFTGQSSSNLVLTYDLKVEANGAGEKLRLMDGTTPGVELFNSHLVNGLAIVNSKTDHIKIADLVPNQWHTVKAVISTDSHTFDVYLDDELVWGGAVMQNPINEINKLAVSSGWLQTGYTSYFDNIVFQGPIGDGNNGDSGNGDGDGNGGDNGNGDNGGGPDPTLFSDTFDGDLSQWTLSKGTWRIQSANTDNVLNKNDPSGSGYISVGDTNWSNYSVSAKVKRDGQMVGILGRYRGSKQYYQLAIKNNGTYILNRNNNGQWLSLASGSFSNSPSQFYELKLTFNGNQITGFIDGQQVANVSDNSFSSGKVGLRSQNGNADFDDVLVEL